VLGVRDAVTNVRAAEHEAIDGSANPPPPSGSDPNHITRDLEIALEAEVRALCALEEARGDGRRAAYGRVVARLHAARAALEGENEDRATLAEGFF
jgi:hypothetical protein